MYNLKSTLSNLGMPKYLYVVKQNIMYWSCKLQGYLNN